MFRLGIDLGGTNIVAGVVNENYEIIATDKIKTNMPRPAEEIVDDIAKAAINAAKKAGLDIKDIAAVGIGTPGSINPITGIVTFSNTSDFTIFIWAKCLKSA